jgi:hypothetical protein
VVETAGGWLRVPDGALAGRSHVLHVRAHHRTAALHDIRHMPLPPRAAEERRLVLVGDTHGLHEHVPMPTGDVLLLHGDVYFQSRGGPWLDIVEGAVALQTLAAFFGAQPHPYKVELIPRRRPAESCPGISQLVTRPTLPRANKPPHSPAADSTVCHCGYSCKGCDDLKPNRETV